MDPAGEFEPRTAVTACLRDWREGDSAARERLFELVYEQLKRIAHNALGRERSEHALATTDLVHETYLKLVDQTQVEWRNRSHFFAVAAQAMRRILVDYARRRGAGKRGANPLRVPLVDDMLTLDERADVLVAVDEALTRLSELDPRLAQVVEFRFFAGLTEEVTAETLGVTARTVRRDWTKAKSWLYGELNQPEP